MSQDTPQTPSDCDYESEDEISAGYGIEQAPSSPKSFSDSDTPSKRSRRTTPDAPLKNRPSKPLNFSCLPALQIDSFTFPIADVKTEDSILPSAEDIKADGSVLFSQQVLNRQALQLEVSFDQRQKWIAAMRLYKKELEKLTSSAIDFMQTEGYTQVTCKSLGKLIATNHLGGYPVHALHYGIQVGKWWQRLPHVTAPAFRVVQFELADRGYNLRDVSEFQDTSRAYVKIMITCGPMDPPCLGIKYWHRLDRIY